MIDKQKILFLAGTEYHILVTLSAIADRYSDPDKFEIVIYHLESDHTKRFRPNVNLGLSHVSYRSINHTSSDQKVLQHFRNEMRAIEQSNYDQFVFFNEHVELCVYLAKSLSAQGTHVILAPDGMKAYDNLTQLTPRWSFQFLMRYRTFIKNNGLNGRYNFVWTKMRYAFLRETAELWITNPARFNNWNNKKVTKIEVMQTAAAVTLINKFFDFDPAREVQKRDKIIFIICMPPKYKDIEDFNERLIAYLLAKFHDHEIILKLHPATTSEQIERLQRFERCTLLQTDIPAELFIAQFVNSIIISYWSTASLINNAKCRFYWLYRALEKEIVMPGILKIKNPTDHITEVQSVAEIQ